MVKLTPKQKRFVDEYLIDLNATRAYKTAYPNVKKDEVAASASVRLLRNVKVQEYLQQRMNQLENIKIATITEILEYLTTVLRGEMKEECVVVENIGDYQSEARIIMKQVTPKDRNKAAELLGKRYGMFTDKLNLEGAIPVVISGDDELED